MQSLLPSGPRGKGLEINQKSEIQEMEYRFIVPSEPTSEAPSEYHSDTEEIEMEEIQKGRRRGEGGRVGTLLVKVQCEVGAVSLETFAVSCLEFVPH